MNIEELEKLIKEEIENLEYSREQNINYNIQCYIDGSLSAYKRILKEIKESK